MVKLKPDFLVADTADGADGEAGEFAEGGVRGVAAVAAVYHHRLRHAGAGPRRIEHHLPDRGDAGLHGL